jgi:hypothetical protein
MKRLVLLLNLLLTLLLPLQSWAAEVVFDAVTNSGSQVDTTQTWSHTTTTNANRAMAVGVVHSTVTTVDVGTYAGVDFLATPIGTADFDGNGLRVSFYRLIAPATGANNVVVTLSAADEWAAFALTASGVHQTTPVGTRANATGASALPTVNVSGATDDLIVDCLFATLIDSAAVLQAGAGQTQRVAIGFASNFNRLGSSTEPGAPSVTMSWTDDISAITAWAISGVALKAAAGGGAETFGFRKRQSQ